MLRGIDVSSHQPQISWSQVAAAGYSFAVIKITGGDQYVNPIWRKQYDGARQAGLAVGFYHYDGEPTVSTGTAAAEAGHFLRNLPSPLPDDVFLCLDAEERPTRDPGRYRDWLVRVRAATGKTPYIYSYPSFIKELAPFVWEPVAEFPLWYASYPARIDPLPPAPPVPAPWTSYRFWQYSGGTSIPGIPNATDANAFYGSVAELTGAAAPPPAFQHAPGWLDPIVDTFVWEGAGIITYRKVRVYNDEEKRWYEREWQAETGYAEWKDVTP